MNHRYEVLLVLTAVLLARRGIWYDSTLLVGLENLLVLYRILQRTKYGVKMDFGVPYQTNQYIWWLLLPALVALANLLPRLRPTGKLPPQVV